MDIILIPIDQSGNPIDFNSELQDVAKEVCVSYKHMYESKGYQPPWIGYFAWDGNQIIGTCSFKSAPTDNKVEIAYFTFPEYENQGYATSMVKVLVQVAQQENAKVNITAQTLPEENASTSVLKKLGFEFLGEIEHQEDGLVWDWGYKVGFQNRI